MFDKISERILLKYVCLCVNYKKYLKNKFCGQIYKCCFNKVFFYENEFYIE